ncbi:MAG: PTS sugar transporter subunit IIC [candidate division WOR-3 bacterium]
MIVLFLVFIGAIILLDKYTIGEFGVSQPIIAGTIIGALCGDLKSGIFIGALFQMLFLANLPIGKDVPPDAQAAGIAGCGSYFVIKVIHKTEPNLIIIFLIGILTAVLGSFLDVLVRRVNEKFYHWFLRDKRQLNFSHMTGVGVSLIRGVILFALIFGIVSIIGAPVGGLTFNKEFLMVLVASLGIANGIYLYLRKQSFYAFLLGLICALVYFVF